MLAQHWTDPNLSTCFFWIHTQEVCSVISSSLHMQPCLLNFKKKKCVPKIGSRKRRVVPWLWHIFLFVFICVVCVYMCICMCVHTRVWRPEVDVQNNLPLILPHLWRRGLSVKPRAHHRGQLAKQKTPFLPSQAGIVGGAPGWPGIYMGPGDLGSSPHTCMAKHFNLPSRVPESGFSTCSVWQSHSKTDSWDAVTAAGKGRLQPGVKTCKQSL